MSERTQQEWDANPFKIGEKYKVTKIHDQLNMSLWFSEENDIEYLGTSTGVTGFKNHSKNGYIITLRPVNKYKSKGTTVQEEPIGGNDIMVTTNWTVESVFTSSGEKVTIHAENVYTGRKSPDGEVITIPPK